MLDDYDTGQAIHFYVCIYPSVLAISVTGNLHAWFYNHEITVNSKVAPLNGYLFMFMKVCVITFLQAAPNKFITSFEMHAINCEKEVLVEKYII